MSKKSAGAAKAPSRSPFPEYSHSDPDFQPTSRKKVAAPKESKAPPKKRGRPRKNKDKEAKKSDEDDPRFCPICKEIDLAKKLVNTPCGHIFHRLCLQGWQNTTGQILRELAVCPKCGVDYNRDLVNPCFI